MFLNKKHLKNNFYHTFKYIFLFFYYRPLSSNHILKLTCRLYTRDNYFLFGFIFIKK